MVSVGGNISTSTQTNLVVKSGSCVNVGNNISLTAFSQITGPTSGGYGQIRVGNGITRSAATTAISGNVDLCIQNNPNIRPSGAGTIPPSVTFCTNNVNCVPTQTCALSCCVKPTLVITPIAICKGDSDSLSASGATTYKWSTGDTTPSISVSPSVTTTYTVIGTTSGCSDTATVVVTVNPTPILSVIPQKICEGSTATLTANGAATYSWNTGAQTAGVSVSPLTTTTYTVVGTSVDGCNATTTVTVTVNPNPSITTTGANVCTGQSGTISSGGALSYIWQPGNLSGASQILSPVQTTTYTVTGTDADGCSNTAVAVITVNQNPVISATGGSICKGGGSVQMGSSGAVTYSWIPTTGLSNANIANPIASLQQAATYTVTGTDANGCSNTAVALIILNPAPTITSALKDVLCFGSPTGSITATPSAGSTPYSYLWNNGQSNQTASGLIAGAYTITVTDANNCTAIESITITEPPALILTISGTSVCPNALGSAGTTVSGGTLNYTYQWNNGQTTSLATGLSIGNYTLTVTDAKGCTTTNTISINSNPAPTANFTSKAVCFNNPTVMINNSMPGSGLTYSWNLGNGNTSTLQ
ncbi:MAG: SprB repeat-containing protein, partial [Bacteroidetes bacterium]|nr:SprB repeat-containing protein [Bacteroidota bacterium]